MQKQSELFPTRKFQDHQDWVSWLNRALPKPNLPSDAPIVLDLFAGCGGLALGFESQGFKTLGFEMKPRAVETYNANLCGKCEEVKLAIGAPDLQADVIIGGPPCQPFSQIGYQRGNRDTRDGFPIFLDAVNRIKPKIVIMENVRGLLYRNKDYFRKVADELEKFGYAVDARLLNAVEFGTPQRRERVFIIASMIGWDWPERTVDEPVSAGVALGQRAFEFSEESRFLTQSMDEYIAKYERKSNCVNPRDLHLDRPSRTVTCRNLGGATSDMMRVRLPDGKRRMLSTREGALLQSFPEWFEFSGSEGEQCEQIGNAVPPLLGLAIATQVRKALECPEHKFANKDSGTHQKQLGNLPILTIDNVAQKIEQSLNIIRCIGVSVRELTSRQRDCIALCLLAIARVQPNTGWSEASKIIRKPKSSISENDILEYVGKHYSQSATLPDYSGCLNGVLDILVTHGLVIDKGSGSSKMCRYDVATHSVPLLQGYGTEAWEDELVKFRTMVGTPDDRLSKAKEFQSNMNA